MKAFNLRRLIPAVLPRHSHSSKLARLVLEFNVLAFRTAVDRFAELSGPSTLSGASDAFRSLASAVCTASESLAVIPSSEQLEWLTGHSFDLPSQPIASVPGLMSYLGESIVTLPEDLVLAMLPRGIFGGLVSGASTRALHVSAALPAAADAAVRAFSSGFGLPAVRNTLRRAAKASLGVLNPRTGSWPIHVLELHLLSGWREADLFGEDGPSTTFWSHLLLSDAVTKVISGLCPDGVFSLDHSRSLLLPVVGFLNISCISMAASPPGHQIANIVHGSPYAIQQLEFQLNEVLKVHGVEVLNLAPRTFPNPPTEAVSKERQSENSWIPIRGGISSMLIEDSRSILFSVMLDYVSDMAILDDEVESEGA